MTTTQLERPTSHAAAPDPGQPTLTWKLLAGTAIAAFGAVGITSSVEPVVGWSILGAVSAIAVFLLCAYRPIIATYVYFATLPIVAGIDRDHLIPLVRPNEAILTLVLLGAMVGGYLRLCQGARWPVIMTRADLALAVFAFFSTVWPLASLLIRGVPPVPIEYAAVLPACKLIVVYLLVRFTVSTERATVNLIRIIVWSGALIAVIASLQTLKVGWVIAALHTVWLPDEDVADIAERGATTLASPIVTGDFIIIALILVICCNARKLLGTRESLFLGTILGIGVFAAGQFSTWISAIVAFGLLAWRFPELRRRAVRALPLMGLAVAVGAPALVTRLEGFSGLGLPVSWLGRYDNLTNFYLPRFDVTHILLGVSPEPVLQAPETWREVIYLEAGYLYFLWIGGIPLLIAFAYLSVVVLRTVRIVRLRLDARGACGAALEIVWWFVLVLTVIDPHLTLRGTGDLIFALLAITVGRFRDQRV